MSKLPSDDTLLKLKETLTLQQIADRYSVTRQAVQWRLDRIDGYVRRKDRNKTRNKAIRKQRRERHSVVDIANEFDLSLSQTYAICSGIEVKRKLSPIGCDKCKTETYQKKLRVCKNCYQKIIHRNLLEEYLKKTES